MKQNPIDSMKFDKIDMSQFHPLGTHLPYGRECRDTYGGGRNHWKLWWEYKARGRVRSHTLCRIGRHTRSEWWKRDNPEPEILCLHCLTPMEKDEGETHDDPAAGHDARDRDRSWWRRLRS